MTRKRAILFFWVLLLVPTILIGGTAFTLLTHEQERINQAALAALKDRASAIAGTIHTTMEGLQRNLTQSLKEIKPDKIQKTLHLWEQTNPLIRNVFIWDKERGLLYPAQGMPPLESTREERRFINRYDAFFSGQMPWKWNVGSAHTPQRHTLLALASPGLSEKKFKPPAIENDERPPVLDDTVNDFGTTESGGAFTTKDAGWIPWFSENRLFILGWVTVARNKDSIYGVELELMTLLSRLLPHLPSWTEHHAAYALLNGNAELLHQSGGFPIDLRQTPHTIQPISPLLPHWQIATYLTGESVEGQTSFMVISGMLLSIFIISIVSGAALLTWQAHLHRRDALQKTSFVSSVSHELKTPLTSIRMYAELLQAGRVRSPDKTAHYLNVIVSESQRLTRLVNNVLDFGRLEQGRKTYHRTRFDLGMFVRTIVKNHSIRLRESGMTTDMLISEIPMPVTNDPDALEQVVLNIVDNAIKYASQGKTLRFSLKKLIRDEMLVEKNLKTNYADYRIKICDNGPGIAKKHRKKIFEKFHRVDDTLTSRQPGSGLGLSIARKMARDLGGDLLFEPSPNGGCCFSITLMDSDKQ